MKDSLLRYAWAFALTPYGWGKQGFRQVDCSGFIVELFRGIGLLKNREDLSAQAFFHAYEKAPQVFGPGALSFYGKSLNHITHIGFCVSDTLMLEAGGGDSSTLGVGDAEKRGAFVRLRPIRYREDFLGVRMPDYEDVR